MTGRPRHGVNSAAFLSLSLQHRAGIPISSRTDATHTYQKKTPAEPPWLPVGGVNGEVQRNGATMLSAA